MAKVKHANNLSPRNFKTLRARIRWVGAQKPSGGSSRSVQSPCASPSTRAVSTAIPPTRLLQLLLTLLSGPSTPGCECLVCRGQGSSPLSPRLNLAPSGLPRG